MKHFATSYYKPLTLMLLLLLGCKEKIGAPEGVPASSDTTEPVRLDDSDSRAEQGMERSLTSDAEVRESERVRMDETAQTTAQPMAKPVQAARYQCSRPELRGTSQLSLRRLTKDE